MLPSLHSVLVSDAVRKASPEILSGASQLERSVRWVHVSEVTEVAGLLQGGELILSTGISMSGSEVDAVDYLKALIDSGACGLILELSDRFPLLPDPVLAAARDRDFPIIVLHQQARFVAITEEVHRAIVADQYAHVEFAHRVHETFTALSLESASAQAIVETAARLCGSSVILEDLNRNVIAFSAHGPTADALLADWRTRSRLVPAMDHTGIRGPENWMTSPVGLRSQGWGRLVIPHFIADQERLGMLLERAAQALELGRMVELDRVGIKFQAQGGLLDRLAQGRATDEADARASIAALGIDLAPSYVAVVAHQHVSVDRDPLAAHRRGRRLVERVSDAVRDARVSALVGALESHQVGMLVAVPARKSEDSILRALADALLAEATRPPELDGFTLGVGSASSSVVASARTLHIAQHVAAVSSAMARSGAAKSPYYRNTDIRIHGLISQLHDDPRMQAFVEAELERLLVHEAKHGDGLVDLLRQFLAVGGNKTELSRVSHRSRPALYKKLDQIERILGVPLSDPASRLSLGVAVVAYDHER